MSNVNLIYGISLNQITQYLVFNGWNIDDEYKNKKLKVFYKDGLNVTLPSNEKFNDYNIRLSETIDLLSDINSQKNEDIIDEIKSIARDKLSFRIIGNLSEDGRIPLSYAVIFVNAIRNLIISAGCGEENPKPYYKRLPSGSKKYSDNFEFAQTKMGSFVFNIETKDFHKEDIPRILDEHGIIKTDIPLERKIIKRVITGLKQIEKDSFINLEQTYDNGYIKGINANMCDAILQFKDISEDIEIESTIKPSKLFEGDDIKEEKILINKLSFNTAEIISKTYKDEENYLELSINATVQHITADTVEDGAGSVVVKFKMDNKDRRAKLYLYGKKYRDACEALKDKTTIITVEGVLNMTKARWEFDQVNRFEIVK